MNAAQMVRVSVLQNANEQAYGQRGWQGTDTAMH